MNPISLTATVLNRILDFGWYVVWFGGWMFGVDYLMDYAAFSFVFFSYAWIPGGIVLGLFFGYVLRPVRKAGYMWLAKGLARSPLRTLREVGIWRLLRVAYRYWPQEPVTDFIGLAALHKAYDESAPKWRERMYAVVRQMESSPGCPVAQAAHDFLDEIGEEADSAAPDDRVSHK
jgi:hypothetical protein